MILIKYTINCIINLVVADGGGGWSRHSILGKGEQRCHFGFLPEVLEIQFSISIAVLGLALHSIYIGVGGTHISNFDIILKSTGTIDRDTLSRKRQFSQ